MTAPIPQGFPDWGRQFSEAQILEVNDNNLTAVGFVDYPNRYVGNAKGLQVWAQTNTVGAFFELLFWGDLAQTVLMDSYQIQLLPPDTCRQFVPILGPYMSASVNPNGGGSNNFTFQIWRTPQLASFPNTANNQTGISIPLTNINAGATQTTRPVYVSEGEFAWSVQATATTWEARIVAYTSAGTFVTLDRMDSAQPVGAIRHCYVPPVSIGLSVTNFDGVIKAYQAYATRKHNA